MNLASTIDLSPHDTALPLSIWSSLTPTTSSTPTMSTSSNASTINTPNAHTLPPSITIFNTAYDRPWTDEETRLLSELIGQQQIVHHKNNIGTSTTINYSAGAEEVHEPVLAKTDSMVTSSKETDNSTSVPIVIDACVTNPFKINWISISMKLGRPTTSLLKQYNLLKQSTYRHGAFTNVEDVHIIKRYLEWKCIYKDAAKSGIWSLLERELNRQDKRISERWRHVLCKRLAKLLSVDDEHNIIDPLKALVIWKSHQEEMHRVSGISNHNGYGAYSTFGAGFTTSSSTASSSKATTTPGPAEVTSSALKKRAYSATDSVISGNSYNTADDDACRISEGLNTNITNCAANAGPGSTIDSAMNDINYILHTMHNEEYTNNSILSLGSSVYDGNNYGSSVWSTIHNNNQTQNTDDYSSYNNVNNTKQYTDDFMNDDSAFSSSVWNSITNSGASTQAAKKSKSANSINRWTDEQDARLREAVSLFPRDWVKISEFMGISESSSKCRKRWARLQQKYQQTLSSALQDATHCSLLEAADPDADPEFDPDLDTNNFESLEPPGGLFSHIHNVAENDEDDMELYRDLQEIRGELDL